MMFHNWNELSINPSTRIKWRASLVPAAAVIPAPLAYIKIVAVKTFEVDTCPTQAGTADPVTPWSVEHVGIWLDKYQLRTFLGFYLKCPLPTATSPGSLRR